MAKNKDIKSEFKTTSGITIAPFYPSAGLEAPGEYPFTRGIHSSMYRSKLWTMRQYAGYGTAAESNERYQYLLKQGTTGLSVAFDLPTQMGRDSDHPIAKGEVGKVGVAVCTIDDIEILFKDIPLDQVSISMTINATAGILLAFLLVAAERRNISWHNLNGTIQNDVLKEYIARGTYIYPPRSAVRIITDIISFCGSNVPKWNTISISGYHIREAGSTASQEIAFTIADGITYVQAAINAGLSVDAFGERLAFFFNCHNEFFEEIAKFRAARRLWAKIMKERFNATNPRAMMLRFHTQTAGSSLTAQQPHNNVIRTTLQALASVLGGTQSLHTNSYDEALCLPTAEAATLALRTQQVIAHESGVTSTVDPLGGSPLIEELTNKLEQEAATIIEKIDNLGGMIKAIEQRYPQSEIEKSAYTYQQEIENNQRVIVGVNQFNSSDENSLKVLRPDPKGESEQCLRLAKYRKSRDSNATNTALANLKSAAHDTNSNQNLMNLIVSCVRANATLGEISDALRNVFGEYHE